MQYAAECGVDAVLIGETLMRSGVDGIAECMRALINI
jgi:indole-3-glycerol phosphate synthase